MSGLTHIDENGNAVMVDIAEKEVTLRTARASGLISMSGEAFKQIWDGNTVRSAKGDVLAAARIAGIMATKKTPELIPLCHSLLLTGTAVEFCIMPKEHSIKCECSVKLHGRTGAEMEALTGVSVALLTIYDMCKAVDKDMEISRIRLEEKEGGANGHFIRGGSV
ncbi:MAG: cyclic pyranopterin monophosphate synthase MoaC [Lachnospiraceae bacterium]|nr:cyclic pyranopterin monophosphate synthase MoaC [Lachnospiraceae bacterium]